MAALSTDATAIQAQHAGLIETIARDVRAFEDPFVAVNVDAVRFPDGRVGTYARVRSGTGRGAVAIVRRQTRGQVEIALVRQHRYPIDAVTWELPRGTTTEDTLGGLRREIAEEIGAAVHRARRIGRLHPDTGLLTTEVDVYDVRVSTGAPRTHVEAETGLALHWVEMGQLSGMIAGGQVTCAMTLASLAVLRASGNEVLPW